MEKQNLDDVKHQTPLGHFSLAQGTFEYDLSLQDRYQGFSAELLRLSLLGISAIGLLALEFLPGSDSKIQLPSTAIFCFLTALASFGICAITALLHRYASVDSLSWHLQSLRRETRKDPGDQKIVDKERRIRLKLFKISRVSVFISALSLAIGGSSLAWAVYEIFRIFPSLLSLWLL